MIVFNWSSPFVCSPVNQSPVQNARSTVYPTLDTSTASNANPFDEDDEDNDTSLKEKSTNNG